MRCIVAILWCSTYFISPAKSFGADIILNKRDAVVWLEKQTITGRVRGFYTSRLIVSCNDQFFKIRVKKDSMFSFVVTLQSGVNKILVRTISGVARISGTVNLSLGFKPAPVIMPYAVSKERRVELHMKIIKNPWKEPLHFLWSGDSRNPRPCSIRNKNDSIAFVNIPPANSTYYFNLQVSTSEDTVNFQTFISKNQSEIHVFNMDKDHASWIDDAIIYEITPSAFVKNGGYDDITNKLDEIKQLGINTIWLQPIYNSFNKGQGYDVVDYFSLREDLGNPDQLKKLVDRAKQLRLRVLFDFVPNHTSIHHPYAKDCIKYGIASHYYDFYQHKNDGVAYSSFYKKDKYGFINYFWEDLVNLNYDNEEVQQWITEACKYWIKKYDIDGYRFDAIWAVNARMPSFGKKLRLALKSIKPDLLLLAEDKGSLKEVYKAGFDAAYDWAADTSWISHWPWQYQYAPRKNLTIFNYPDASKRPAMLKSAIFNNGATTHLRLRFIEDNDLPRFTKDHTLSCTKMAAALLFSLPGIPMVYNGQETGFGGHPYSRHAVFEAGKSIRSLDSNHLYDFYQNLIRLRKEYPALSGNNINNWAVWPADKMAAFHRWKNDEDFIVILNMDSIPIEAVINVKNILRTADQKENHSYNYNLEDILTRTLFKTGNRMEVKIPMSGYGIRWLLLSN